MSALVVHTEPNIKSCRCVFLHREPAESEARCVNTTDRLRLACIRTGRASELQITRAYRRRFPNNNSRRTDCRGAFASPARLYHSSNANNVPDTMFVWSEMSWRWNWREVGNGLRQKGVRTSDVINRDVWKKNANVKDVPPADPCTQTSIPCPWYCLWPRTNWHVVPNSDLLRRRMRRKNAQRSRLDQAMWKIPYARLK